MKTPKLSEMPEVPDGATFALQKIDTIFRPHPYCITPKHVEVAADHHGGMLGEAAIIDAEKRGAVCDTCKQLRNGILSYKAHESLTTLFILVEDNSDLNKIPGLHKYLYENKQVFEKLGIQGFAFTEMDDHGYTDSDNHRQRRI